MQLVPCLLPLSMDHFLFSGGRMKVRFFVLALGTLGLVATQTGCSDIRLAPLDPEKVNVSSKGDFCTASPELVKRYTKFMFVMDKSGSNQNPGTDPGAERRAGSFERFYEANKSNQGLQWGMIEFRGDSSEALIGPPDDPIFTQDEAEVRSGIEKLRQADSDATPYGSALNTTRLAIRNDMERHPDEDNIYQIFFLSDGEPTDVTDEGRLRAMVRDIVNLSPGKVFLSTGYYNKDRSNQTAISRLEAMAEEGLGKFINFRNSPDFDFGDLIVDGPSRDPWVIKNMVVYNLSSSMCENGLYDMDSDGDGVCDRDEEKYNGYRDSTGRVYRFDPTRRFSTAGSGYGDYFYWRQMKFGESLPTCTDRSDEDYDMLTKCEEARLANANPIPPAPGIVIPTQGDYRNPDTDLDGYIDGIELLSFRLPTAVTNSRDVLTDHDNEGPAGMQIKQHKNPLLWDPNNFAYDTQLTPIGVKMETGQSCYNFSQSRLQLFNTKATPADGNFPGHSHAAGENLVYVYYIQTLQREPLSRGVLQFSLQKLKAETQGSSDIRGESAGLKVSDAIFNTYVVPKE